MSNIVFRVPEGLLFGCMKFGGLWVGLGHGSKVFTLRWVGLDRVSGLVGWVGLDKLDPRTNLSCFDVSNGSVGDWNMNVDCAGPEQLSVTGRPLGGAL